MQQSPGESVESTINAPGRSVYTSDLEKVPAAYRPLFDPAASLAGGVRFFERRQTYGQSLKALMIGVALAIVGAALVFPGVLIDIYVAFVGLVFVLGGVLMIGSFRSQMRALKTQREGGETRY